MCQKIKTCSQDSRRYEKGQLTNVEEEPSGTIDEESMILGVHGKRVIHV
jgi:hypothetical protein